MYARTLPGPEKQPLREFFYEDDIRLQIHGGPPGDQCIRQLVPVVLRQGAKTEIKSAPFFVTTISICQARLILIHVNIV